MKKLYLILLLFPLFCRAVTPQPFDASAGQSLYEYSMRVFVVTDYYVSSSGSDSNNGTSSATPWQTLTQVETVANAGTIVAGDRILFKSGEQFSAISGNMRIAASGGGRHAKSGTDLLHITWTTYGGTAKAIFLYPGSATGAGADNRTILALVGVRRWDFINLQFTDLNHTNDKKTGAHCGFALYLGDAGGTKTNSCTIDNCDFSYIGMGPVFSGDSNVLTRSTLTDFKDLIGNSGPGDYGANAVTMLDGNYNEVSYCYINGAWAQSTTFGFNGGFAEIFGSCSFNVFKFNTLVDCNGVSEFGSNGGAAACTDNWYVGNFVLSCGAAFYANISGTFTVEVANTYYWQNTHIETTLSRFSGANCGHGLPDSASIGININCDQRAMGYNTAPAAAVIYNSKNNIFQFATGCDIYQSGTGTKTVNIYNAYKLSNGSSENKSLGTGEFNVSGSLFTQTTGNDPSTWDLNLPTGSQAKGTGQTDALYTVDMNGNPFSNNMGALGVVSAVPPGTITNPAYINGVLYLIK